MTGQRLDKWLWCARAAKTRSAAARLIADGKVRINGERVRKPSRIVQRGDVITATPPGRLVVWRILDAADRRGPAPLARTLYEDLTPPVGETETGSAREARVGARPTKRDRRRIDTFRTFWS
ncbi:RNA-binding S4 domain-containing protein [Methyloceanibacter caenitepidi]|uniref:Ribosome-associated heat shock protein n=1 Tax=Methyloceanibacter caenitepidi TaxID=1384459 RepID=A0A0A8K732_9HYPH|nr:RNA-binding S4 domain-containing protein [Methyloceanibacter caenitepidi]BAQ18730.1 ribosome-associated heat shock protein [Methyloceanibacter caenitepidi]